MSAREEGNQAFQQQHYRLAIKWYTKAIDEVNEERELWACYSNRSGAYLSLAQQTEDRETQKQLQKSASKDAQECIRLDPMKAKGFSRLAASQHALAEYSDAILAYKQGLDLDPDNEIMQQGLKNARVAQLNQLIDTDEDSLALEECKEEKNDHTPPDLTTSIREAPEIAYTKFVGVVTPELVIRMIIMKTVNRLKSIPNVQEAAIALAVGLICNLVVHSWKILGAGIMLTGLYYLGDRNPEIREFYHSKFEAFQNWLYFSLDKVQGILALLGILYFIPIFLGIYGQVKLFYFVHSDKVLALLVFFITSTLIWYENKLPPEQRESWWGRGKRLKLAGHIIILVYWVILLQNHNDLFRLLAPAAINTAGILLQIVPTDEVQKALRESMRESISEIVGQTDIDLDSYLFLGVISWTVEYWQQPTTFTVTELIMMMQSTLSNMQSGVTKSFRPEIQRFKRQFGVTGNDDYKVFVEHVKHSLDKLPPSRPATWFILLLKRCSSIMAFLFLLWRGLFAWAMLPFAIVELDNLFRVWNIMTSEEYKDFDSVELILFDSKLSLIWSNMKAGVVCLEASLTLSKAVAAGSSAVRMVGRLCRVAEVAARVRMHGVASSLGHIGSSVLDMGGALEDSSTIAESFQHLAESNVMENVASYVSSWFHGESTTVRASSREDKSE